MEEFTYDIPTFLQAAFKANGPPDLSWHTPTTSPDCLVPAYVDNWWEDQDIRNLVGKPRDWQRIEGMGLVFHSDMVSGLD